MPSDRSRTSRASFSTRKCWEIAGRLTVDPDPAVAASLAELGVDLGAVASEPPSPALLQGAELVVVMGYVQGDPAGGRRSEDWCIDDPRG